MSVFPVSLPGPGQVRGRWSVDCVLLNWLWVEDTWVKCRAATHTHRPQTRLMESHFQTLHGYYSRFPFRILSSTKFRWFRYYDQVQLTPEQRSLYPELAKLQVILASHWSAHTNTELWLAAGRHQPAEGVRAAAPQPDLLQQPRRRPRRCRRRADRIQLLINENIFGNTEIFSMKSFANAPPFVSRLMYNELKYDEVMLCFVWTQTHRFESRMCHIGEVN